MGSEWYILDDVGAPHPASIDAWAAWCRDHSKHIAKTEISGELIVSTVFLGLDHGWGDGPPLLFETMVFGGKLDQEQDRYSTKAEALLGHKAMVERVRASTDA